jgi:hypothetical protein
VHTCQHRQQLSFTVWSTIFRRNSSACAPVVNSNAMQPIVWYCLHYTSPSASCSSTQQIPHPLRSSSNIAPTLAHSFPHAACLSAHMSSPSPHQSHLAASISLQLTPFPSKYELIGARRHPALIKKSSLLLLLYLERNCNATINKRQDYRLLQT